ncbi:hypothetical protein D3C87_1529290 [compost metagenome]
MQGFDAFFVLTAQPFQFSFMLFGLLLVEAGFSVHLLGENGIFFGLALYEVS